MKKLLYIFIILISLTIQSHATCDSTAATLVQLNTNIAAASPDDIVCVTNGTYDDFSDQNGNPVTVQVSGTDGHNIVIQPETVGGVTFTGTFYMLIGTDETANGSYITVKNFKFHENESYSPSTITAKILRIYGDNVLVTNNKFTDVSTDGDQGVGSAVKYYDDADDGEVSYNTFDTWYSSEVLHVQKAYNTHIHHNYFTSPYTGTQDSALYVGTDSDEGRIENQNTIVEYNYFYSVLGDSETISNKGHSNIYRYNVFVGTTALTLRAGDDCQVYGNYLLNIQGNQAAFRIFGARHKVFNNYLEDWTTGYGGVYLGAEDEDHDVADDAIIASNTVISRTSGSAAFIVGDGAGTSPDGVTFSNNYAEHNSGWCFYDNSGTNTVYTTNFCNDFSTGDYDNVSNSFCTTRVTSSPLTNDGQIYRLTGVGTNGSGAVAGVTVDIDGDSRADPPDMGADEYSASAPTITTASIIAGAGYSEQIEAPPVDYGKTKMF